MRRTLSAVLAADVVGYSRLMHDDEEGTLTALRRLRSEVIGPTVASAQGRIAKSMGDGWLMTFDAITNSIKCAIKIQDRVKTEGGMQLRMGVHLGDIAEVDEDIFGGGVNLASRLQTLAEPGALAVSGTAIDLLDGTLRPSFRNAGERVLKNIPHPIEVWVRGGELAASKSAIESVGLPQLAILPTVTHDADAAVQDLAMGITGEQATHLNALRYLKSRVTGTPGADEYQLTSQLRRQSNMVRLEAQLTAPTGAQVMAAKFDGELANAFEWQDRSCLALSEDVINKLIAFEAGNSAHLPDDACTAEQLLLRMIAIGTTDGPGLGRMVGLMSKAIDKSPDWGIAYAYAIGKATLALSNGARRHVKPYLDRLEYWRSKVEELEPPFSPARIVLALSNLVQTGDRQKSKSEVRRVLRNLPFDPEALHWAAWTYAFSGEPFEALNCIDKAEQSVIPLYAKPSIANAKAMSCLLIGQYDKSVLHAARAAEMTPEDIGCHLITASACALAGDQSGAARAIEEALRLSPGYSLRNAGWRADREYPETIGGYYRGLRTAGLPE